MRSSRLRHVILGATALLLVTAATAAAAVPGDPFRLGVGNTINATTTLTGSVASRLLGITNTSAAAGARALLLMSQAATSTLYVENQGTGSGIQIRVADGRPPLTVNATAGKAANLNVDRIDGLDSTAFSRRLWAVVKDDGTLLRGVGATSVAVGGGGYFVRFNTDVSNCAYVATVGQAATAYFDPGEIQAHHSTGNGNATRDVYVAISDTDTGAISRGFSLVVVC